MAQVYGIDPIKGIVSKEVNYVYRDPETLSGSVQKVLQADSPAQGSMLRQAQRNYQYDTIQYPSDLGEGTRHPYFMTFYVNIQDLSKWAKRDTPNDLVARIGDNRQDTIRSTVQINQRGANALAKNLGETNIGFGRKTSRTKAAIRLYVPDTLSWSYENKFRDPSLSGAPGARALQAIGGAAHSGAAFVDEFARGGFRAALSSLGETGRGALGPFIESTIGGALGDESLALSAFGLAVNPQIDVIYDSPNLRTFNFEFMFAPRSASEGATVREIINQFKFHAAPEVYADGGIFGRYFVPPSEFDIEFSIPTMGKISTCVLNNITVDYGSAGAQFYSDDSPVYTRMTLAFTELEYVTKEFVNREITGVD